MTFKMKAAKFLHVVHSKPPDVLNFWKPIKKLLISFIKIRPRLANFRIFNSRKSRIQIDLQKSEDILEAIKLCFISF